MKSFKIIALIISISILFSSCASTQTLKQLAISQGMGIDEKDGKVVVTVQLLNLAKNGTSESLSGNITMTSSESGASVSDAVSKLSKAVSKKLFFGQNKMIVFSSSIAKKGLSKNFDYMIRSTDSRPDVALAISSDKASSILESKENDALVPAENINLLMKNGEKSGLGAYVTVNDAMNNYCNVTSDIYMPVLKSEKENVSVEGIGLFDADKMTAVTTDDETLGFLLIKNSVKDGLLSVYDKELGHIGVEIVGCSSKLSSEIKDGKVCFKIKIKTTLMLDEAQKALVVGLKEKKVKEIEKLCEEKIKKLCAKSYYFAVNAKSDCFSVGEYLNMNDKKSYENMKNNWKEYYQNSFVTVKADCKITKVNDNSIRE